ncbi:tryptophan synthase subunit alpha [Penaeicola halotolerans]|uniref:tryptophan synthase subunit alpha n=1 Tax=Penaeicola halotolerans TaxID=2793196 RepID=UPI001CF808E1|nr:tryptophan synthase subunit alpha [Penaeicola halotolerans]
MNRIEQLFQNKDSRLLSVYFTAGYPSAGDTIPIIEALDEAGADIIEIGIPFSDPVADGPTIQESNQAALDQGMTLKKLLSELKDIRQKTQVPLILMGYLNPIIQYGIEKFCQEISAIGIDGIIVPDLPMSQFMEEYKATFDAYDLANIFLISPQTSAERIRLIDENSRGFIYMVSSASITGAKSGISEEQISYFKRVNEMGLKNPRLIGFGISDKATFDTACQYSKGAIIGSAFINVLTKAKGGDLKAAIQTYIQSVIA